MERPIRHSPQPLTSEGQEGKNLGGAIITIGTSLQQKADYLFPVKYKQVVGCYNALNHITCSMPGFNAD